MGSRAAARVTYLRSAARLSWSLARAGFVLRNEGSYLGLLWYLLSPLATFGVILLVKEQAFGDVGIERYPAYLLVGILMHHFLAHVAGDAAGAVAANAGLIKTTRAPREAIVVSRVLQAAASHAVEVAALLALVWGLLDVWPGLAVYLAVFAIFAAFCLGVAFAFAAVGAQVADLRNAWAAVAHLLFFVTPIFHAPEPGGTLDRLNAWNPLAAFIGAARDSLVYGGSPSLADWAALFGWAVVALAAGFALFESRKRRLAELV